MSDEDALPESDDPFEVLGLDGETADRKDVRRSYARLLRRFKPERDPDSFQRLRAAYETALRFFEWRDAQADEDEDDDASEGARASEAGAALFQPDDEVDSADDEEHEDAEEDLDEDEDDEDASSPIWRDLVLSERYDEAVEAYESAAREGPERAWVWIERYALEARRGGEVDVAHAALEAGLLANAPVLPFIFQRIAPPERALLAERDGLSWRTLRECRDREHVRYLFQERIESRLRRGELKSAMIEVMGTSFHADLADDPFLRRIAQQVAVAAHWFDAEQGERVGGWAFDDENADYFERIYLEKGFRREDWTEWAFPETLDRFVSVYDALSPNGAKMAAMDLLNDVEERPAAYAESFLRLSLESSRSPLLEDMHAALESFMPDDEPEPDEEHLRESIAEHVERAPWRDQLPEKPPPPRVMPRVEFWLGVSFCVTSIVLIAVALGMGIRPSGARMLFLVGAFLLVRGFLEWRGRRKKLLDEQSRGDGYIAAFVAATSIVLATGAKPEQLGAWSREEGDRFRDVLPNRIRHVERSRPIAFLALLGDLRRIVQGVPPEEPEE